MDGMGGVCWDDWSVLGWMGLVECVGMDGMDGVCWDGWSVLGWMCWDGWDGWSVLGWMECRFVAWP